MITRAQLTRAKQILRMGGSLAEAAKRIGYEPAALDLALWTGVDGSKAFRAERPPKRQRAHRRALAVRRGNGEAEIRVWTTADERKLRMYWSDGIPGRVIAKALGRTEGAIYARAALISLPKRRSRAAEGGTTNPSAVAAA